MSLWRRLVHGCWWSHSWVTEVAKGKAILVCQECRQKKAVLPTQRLRVKRPAKILKLAERKRA